MTKEEFAKAIKEQNNIISEANKKIDELRLSYFKASEGTIFKIDEKVEVVTPAMGSLAESVRYAIVTRIWVLDDGKFNYSYHKAKKNGTCSQIKDYIYNETIRPITK